MTLFCDSGFDGDDCAWYWAIPAGGFLAGLSPLATKRSRKCCSCGTKIKPGKEATEIARWRHPNNDIEERTHGEGEEISLAPWFFCKPCAGLAESIDELGFCFCLGDNLKDEIAEYRREEEFHKRRLAELKEGRKL